ncbi:tyrosine-protein kinase domain-containing protein [Clostridium perfringens]|uniref:polysaccharide biosynthesis tyrosine autokinase n=1 Tax=Clostridium perfringens TaxID=1502 RepID=UPI001CCDA419|nr:polysaccharide biosynthesis tyrosine autokinase [Clostridium perfringens]UBK69221.1 polysaccharide biosynthesis tyrosine autokinase [Clostridium perfringens]
MEQKIEIKEYLQLIRKRMKIIVAIVIASILIVSIKTFFFTTPIYEAQTTITINNLLGQQTQLTKEDINYNQLLGETYKPIVKSRKVAEEIKKNLNLEEDYHAISNSIDINSVSGPVMNITVKNTDPKVAREIANEVPIVFGDELEKIAKVNGVQVIDEALLPTRPISPNKFRNLALGGIIGLAIAIFVVLLLDYFDNKVKTPEELENTLDTPLLGVVPFENEEERKMYEGNVTIIGNPKSQVSEAYRNTRTNIQFSNLDKNLNVIAITSSKPSEGKSTMISNIGAVFGNLENKKILIIDCDLRNPSIHRMFGLSNTEGLTDVLVGNKTFNQCVQNTEVKNLKVLTTGNIPNNPAEILNSNRMKSFVEETKEHFDYVFIDTPPIGIVSDAGIVSTYSDGIILVAASNEVDDNVIKLSKDRLLKVNANIIGCILNKFDYKNHNEYEYYGYYYSDEGKKRKKRKSK